MTETQRVYGFPVFLRCHFVHFHLGSPPPPSKQVAGAPGLAGCVNMDLLLQAHTLLRHVILTQARESGGTGGNTEKDNTGEPRLFRLRMKNSGLLNIFNHAHNLLIDIGSLTLEKKRHSGQIVCFVKHIVESYFRCRCFRCFF